MVGVYMFSILSLVFYIPESLVRKYTMTIHKGHYKESLEISKSLLALRQPFVMLDRFERVTTKQSFNSIIILTKGLCR